MPNNAKATHIRVTTCTNSCVSTTNEETGITSTADCCGGQVTTRILQHPKPEAPKET
jgi:hypothetical protein